MNVLFITADQWRGECLSALGHPHVKTPPPLFFDKQEDPDEFVNLVADSAYQELVLEYAGKMLSWRMEHDEPALTDLHLARDGVVRE